MIQYVIWIFFQNKNIDYLNIITGQPSYVEIVNLAGANLSNFYCSIEFFFVPNSFRMDQEYSCFLNCNPELNIKICSIFKLIEHYSNDEFVLQMISSFNYLQNSQFIW